MSVVNEDTRLLCWRSPSSRGGASFCQVRCTCPWILCATVARPCPLIMGMFCWNLMPSVTT
eukprot:6390890-Alexandrium_andersonii.AAC.1